MQQTRREIIGGALAAPALAAADSAVKRFVKFKKGSGSAYGILEGDTIHEIQGGLLGNHKRTGAKHPLASAKLLAPCDPPKILAVGRNYKSHLGAAPAPERPELFYKPTTCLQDPGGPIVIPRDATDVHYEGELVLVIGKKARHISEAQVKDVVFGVACGNDVSERQWQGGPKKDLQWWRAKGAETFGPFGPMVVTGLDYGKLLLQTRLNGEVVQNQNTSDLLFNCDQVVAFISKYVTLEPGDLIYTGTPQTTKRMKAGDVVEVEIEGIGVLKNPVVAES